MIFHLGTLMPSAREGPPPRRHPPGRWGRSFHLSFSKFGSRRFAVGVSPERHFGGAMHAGLGRPHRIMRPTRRRLIGYVGQPRVNKRLASPRQSHASRVQRGRCCRQPMRRKNTPKQRATTESARALHLARLAAAVDELQLARDALDELLAKSRYAGFVRIISLIRN